MKKILILGHKGMLGHMVNSYFSNYRKAWKTYTISERWPTRLFKKSLIDFCKKENGDFIINCIGAIHQKTNTFNINYELPLWIDKQVNLESNKCKIIHPGTDCEKDNDDYGISKRKTTDYFLTKKNSRTKIIKTSIIGPELFSKVSLLEWLLKNENNRINGYSEFYWNGNTTLQWCKLCEKIMKNWNNYETLSIPSTECISKYHLLKIIKLIFNKKINIIKKDSPKLNKCLIGNIKSPLIKVQLEELKIYMSGSYYSTLSLDN